ncbi:MAG: TetR/AcrR family transcriptional regulator [Microbacterium sp.]|uniref:TetR/AcrR family transcriptional regulator n=1 Tax=Microbacterium sp. TaxID=51671 RepID=UPI003BB0FBAE
MAKSPTNRQAVVPVLAEAFREHGYEGSSMAILQEATGLGRGSLYNFFPGGKEEMAAAVLADIDAWFRDRVFEPLRAGTDAASARQGVSSMFDEVDSYFRSGRRVCLQALFALGRERDLFETAVRDYFLEWVDSLAAALHTAGADEPRSQAVQIVSCVQGGIALARALDDPSAFTSALQGARANAEVHAGRR